VLRIPDLYWRRILISVSSLPENYAENFFPAGNISATMLNAFSNRLCKERNPRMPRQNVTLKELADELSLSRTTVSLALSGKGDTYRIAPETRRRIEEAAERLGYRPNHMARSMRRGKSDTIGVVFPDVSETYMNRILAGIESVALREGVSLMIATSSLNAAVEARNLEMILDRRVDGLILIPYAPFRGENYSDEAVRRAAESGVPSVAVDRYIPGVNRHAVLGADRKAARELTEKLLDSGCTRPAYLGFDLLITSLEERRRGFSDALKTGLGAGREFLVKSRNPGGSDMEDWLNALETAGEFPDGFLVSTDGLAMKLSRLLKNRFSGGRPPLIARFGEDSPYFPTGMISALQPHEKLGRRAAEMLFSLIAGEVIQKPIEILDMKITGDNV
jgi:LacI family transcriptional regulator